MRMNFFQKYISPKKVKLIYSFIFGKVTRVGDLYFRSEVHRTLDNADNLYNVPVIPIKGILVLIGVIPRRNMCP